METTILSILAGDLLVSIGKNASAELDEITDLTSKIEALFRDVPRAIQNIASQYAETQYDFVLDTSQINTVINNAECSEELKQAGQEVYTAEMTYAFEKKRTISLEFLDKYVQSNPDEKWILDSKDSDHSKQLLDAENELNDAINTFNTLYQQYEYECEPDEQGGDKQNQSFNESSDTKSNDRWKVQGLVEFGSFNFDGPKDGVDDFAAATIAAGTPAESISSSVDDNASLIGLGFSAERKWGTGVIRLELVWNQVDDFDATTTVLSPDGTSTTFTGTDEIDYYQIGADYIRPWGNFNKSVYFGLGVGAIFADTEGEATRTIVSPTGLTSIETLTASDSDEALYFKLLMGYQFKTDFTLEASYQLSGDLFGSSPADIFKIGTRVKFH